MGYCNIMTCVNLCFYAILKPHTGGYLYVTIIYNNEAPSMHMESISVTPAHCLYGCNFSVLNILSILYTSDQAWRHSLAFYVKWQKLRDHQEHGSVLDNLSSYLSSQHLDGTGNWKSFSLEDSMYYRCNSVGADELPK